MASSPSARHASASDGFKRTASRQYGVLNEQKFYANRAYIVVDRQGIVRWAWQEKQNGDRRENRELLAELEQLR